MGKLILEKFEGGTTVLHTVLDDGIDWEASGCSMADVRNDYEANASRLVWQDGATPIEIEVHYPTRKELLRSFDASGSELLSSKGLVAAAEGGDESVLAEMDLKDIEELLDVAIELARVCIDDVHNLDDLKDGKSFHEVAKEAGGSHVRVRRLRTLREGLLPDQLLEDVGLILLTGSKTSESLGKR